VCEGSGVCVCACVDKVRQACYVSYGRRSTAIEDYDSTRAAQPRAITLREYDGAAPYCLSPRCRDLRRAHMLCAMPRCYARCPEREVCRDRVCVMPIRGTRCHDVCAMPQPAFCRGYYRRYCRPEFISRHCPMLKPSAAYARRQERPAPRSRCAQNLLRAPMRCASAQRTR